MVLVAFSYSGDSSHVWIFRVGNDLIFAVVYPYHVPFVPEHRSVLSQGSPGVRSLSPDRQCDCLSGRPGFLFRFVDLAALSQAQHRTAGHTQNRQAFDECLFHITKVDFR